MKDPRSAAAIFLLGMKGRIVHYYKFHIGDFIRATHYLSNEEDLAYRRLLDMYYETEHPIPLETQLVSRRLRIGIEALEFVLSEFFERTELGWTNRRADLEIREYHALQERNRENGKSGGRPKKTQPVSARNPDETLTRNHKPETINQITTKSAPAQKPVDVTDSVWGSFLTVRKAKRAAVTDLAILGIRREAVKAGISLEQALTVCCERGWASFKADWDWQGQSQQQAKGRAPNANAALFASMTHLHQPNEEEHHGRTIDVTPRLG